MARTQLTEKDRQEIEELLPWRAAGTLSAREARRVDEAIAGDAELAQSYELALEELAGSIELNEAEPVPSGRIMNQLFAKIDAEPHRARAPSLDFRVRISDFVASLSPRTLAWCGAAAALVIVVQGGVIGAGALKPQAPAASYQTASAPSAPSAPGAYVLIRFKPDASAAGITALLEAHQASIVEGPSGGGFYKVRVARGPLAQDKLAALAGRLQQDKTVEFASPSQ